jgi:hypothetical protein
MIVVDKGPEVLSYVIHLLSDDLVFSIFFLGAQNSVCFLHYKCNVRWNLHFHFLNPIYKFSCVSVHKTPDVGSQLKPKRVTVNKLIKTGTECD